MMKHASALQGALLSYCLCAVSVVGCTNAESPVAPATYRLTESDDDPDEPQAPPAPESSPADPEESSEPEPNDPSHAADQPRVRAVQDTNVENAALNDWGCDKVLGISALNSYGRWGACCDVHDSCFEQYGCTANSWTPGSKEPPECASICNTNVFTCAFTYPGPGPSVCATSLEKPCGSYRSGPGPH